MTSPPRARKPRWSWPQLRRVWGAPLLLAAAILFGLLASLLGTGAWHWVAWLALCVPLAICARFGHPWRRRVRSPAAPR